MKKQLRESFIGKHINDINILDFLVEHMEYTECEEGGYIFDPEPMKIHRSQLDLTAIADKIASDNDLFKLWLEDMWLQLEFIEYLEGVE